LGSKRVDRWATQAGFEFRACFWSILALLAGPEIYKISTFWPIFEPSFDRKSRGPKTARRIPLQYTHPA